MNKKFVKPNLYTDSICEKIYSMLVILIWCRHSVLPFFRATLLPFGKVFADLLIPSVFVAFIIFSLPALVKRLQLTDLLLYFSVFTLFLLHYCIFPDNRSVLLQKAPSFLFLCLTYYFIGVKLDIRQLGRWIYIASMVSIWVQVVYALFFTKMSDSTAGAGDMNLAYIMLPHICWVICNIFEKPSALNIVTAVVGCIFLFSLGSRGPMLCLLILLILYLLIFKKFKHPLLARTIIIVAAVLAVVLFAPILDLFAVISAKFGLSTRIFTRISENTFFVSVGRDRIRETLIEGLTAHPGIGLGICADRVNAGTYAHNLWLELCYDFGYPLGCTLFLLMAAFIIRGIKCSQPGPERAFILTMLCASFLKLFLSGSYLEEPGLYLLLGVCVGAARRYRTFPPDPSLMNPDRPNLRQRAAV